MGNFKEGFVRLRLCKDIPSEILNVLADLMYFSGRESRLDFLRETRTEKLFTGNFQYLNFELEPVINNFPVLEGPIPIEAYIVCAYCMEHYITDTDMFESLYCDDKFTDSFTVDTAKKALDKRYFSEIVLTVTVNSKKYNSELEDLVEFLKPYLVENHNNKVGHIHDEDGYINKDIFVDKELSRQELSLRNNICNGCERYSLDTDCELFKYCKRAFDIGTSNKKGE